MSDQQGGRDMRAPVATRRAWLRSVAWPLSPACLLAGLPGQAGLWRFASAQPRQSGW